MTCIEKDQKESQMWSDSVKPRLAVAGSFLSPRSAALSDKGRFPVVEAKVLPLCSIHKLFGQRNK